MSHRRSTGAVVLGWGTWTTCGLHACSMSAVRPFTTSLDAVSSTVSPPSPAIRPMTHRRGSSGSVQRTRSPNPRGTPCRRRTASPAASEGAIDDDRTGSSEGIVHVLTSKRRSTPHEAPPITAVHNTNLASLRRSTREVSRTRSGTASPSKTGVEMIARENGNPRTEPPRPSSPQPSLSRSWTSSPSRDG